MRKTMRRGAIAIVLAFLAFVLAGASSASNQAVFNDIVGDDTGGLAPDVTSLSIATSDEGGLEIRLSLNEPNGNFYVGDSIAILIDSDLNGSTGDTRSGSRGIDSGIYIQGLSEGGQGVLRYTFCNFEANGGFDCHPYDQTLIKHERTGTNSHAVTFTNTQQGWSRIGIRVVAYYQSPSDPSAAATDYAPDSGMYIYEVRADPDNDGVTGTADECVHTPGGSADKDHDGCPPFLPTPRFVFSAVRSGGSLVFSRFSVTNAGPATVTARFGGLTTRRRGSGALPRMAGRRLPIGTLMTFIYTNPNYFGSYKVARLTASGSRLVRTGCTPPGRPVQTPCDKVKQ